jgi:probable rRNA maturation factor
MQNKAEIEFIDIEENNEYIDLVNSVLNKCFEVEIKNPNLYISIILTNPENIRFYNKNYRQIDKETDVLSFPMFEKEELQFVINDEKTPIRDVLGDIIISIERVKEQAIEYGHSFEREFAYMLVHGFYHLMGYDHMEEEDKIKMRQKEEQMLNLLNITRK